MATRPGNTVVERRRARVDARRAQRSQRAAGREFQKLVEIMARLRGPDGCPWDREQTIQSLRGFVLEETYEVLDAIDRRDHEALRGEIGDLLFEGVFLAQVETDEGRFTVADSIRAISEKLIRRHPHIFGDDGVAVRTPGQVVEQWEQIKAREQKDAGERRSLLRGVPPTLPSLLRAHEIGTRVAAVGFDWAKTTDVVDKIEEEVAELRGAIGSEGRERAEEEMGDLLFSIANLRESSASSRNQRCVRRMPNSAPDSRRSSMRSRRKDVRFTMRRSRRWKPSGQGDQIKRRQRRSADTGRRLTRQARRSEETKKRRKKNKQPSAAHPSRSGAGRRPATEVMRDPQKQTAHDSVWLVFVGGASLQPRFARPDRGSTRCSPSLTAAH